MTPVDVLWEYGPWLAVATFAVVLVYWVVNYFRVKKLPPTDEPAVGEYRIHLDVGTHIVPFEGTLYYFNKLLNPRHLHIYGKTLDGDSNPMGGELDRLKTWLQQNAHYYALRQGTRKIAFISDQHPIEITPFFKSEQGTGKKVVYATGSITREQEDGWTYVTMQPVDLSDFTLNPPNYEVLENTGKFHADLREKAPLMDELDANREQLRVMERKSHDLADELGKTKDEAEYWRYMAKKQAKAEEVEEEPMGFPGLVGGYLPYGMAFAVGWVVFLNQPQLSQYPPIYGGLLGVVGWFLAKKVLPT